MYIVICSYKLKYDFESLPSILTRLRRTPEVPVACQAPPHWQVTICSVITGSAKSCEPSSRQCSNASGLLLVNLRFVAITLFHFILFYFI